MHELDLVGLRCPTPIVKLNSEVKSLTAGDEVLVVASDPAFVPDVQAWCRRTGHTLVAVERDGERVRARIRCATV
ncbi:MAG: sulfurtransferase TusA family protein [Gammaproteobacteria bacterium]|nr:sulfurtransferase TusA family protein [Gammaproteobacteria bacterium]